MTIPLLTSRGSIANQELYVRALTSIYRSGVRVHDPDFALSQEADPYEKVRRDPVIAQAIDIRLHGVAGRDISMHPGAEDDASKRWADICQSALVEGIDELPEAMYELAQAVIRSSSWAFMHFERAAKPVQLGGEKTKINWALPVRLQDVDRRRFRYVPVHDRDPQGQRRTTTELQLFSVQRERWEVLERPEWFLSLVYQDEEARLGYGRGLLEAIYYYAWIKESILREGVQAVEKWAQGWVTAKIKGLRDASTGKPNPVVQRAWHDALMAMKSSRVLTYDADDELDVIDAPGTGLDHTVKMLTYCDDAIRALVLGAVLPFGGGGSVGSLARAQEEGEVHQMLVRFDRQKLASSMGALVRQFRKLNVGQMRALGLEEAVDPKWNISEERVEDPEKNANVAKTALESGVDLVRDEYHDRIGFRAPTDKDRAAGNVIEGTKPGAAPGPGSGPDPGAGAMFRLVERMSDKLERMELAATKAAIVDELSVRLDDRLEVNQLKRGSRRGKSKPHGGRMSLLDLAEKVTAMRNAQRFAKRNLAAVDRALALEQEVDGLLVGIVNGEIAEAAADAALDLDKLAVLVAAKMAGPCKQGQNAKRDGCTPAEGGGGEGGGSSAGEGGDAKGAGEKGAEGGEKSRAQKIEAGSKAAAEKVRTVLAEKYGKAGKVAGAVAGYFAEMPAKIIGKTRDNYNDMKAAGVPGAIAAPIAAIAAIYTETPAPTPAGMLFGAGVGALTGPVSGVLSLARTGASLPVTGKIASYEAAAMIATAKYGAKVAKAAGAAITRIATKVKASAAEIAAVQSALQPA